MAALKDNGDFGGPPHRNRYEIIDKNGHKHGPFYNLTQVRSYAEFYWPDQEQDEDRTGKGWDIQVVGCGDLQ